MLRRLILVGISAALLVSVGCKKKTPVAPPPVKPPEAKQNVPAPMIDSFTGSPLTIERGQSSTLRWEVRNASEVSIEGLGAVPASGSRQVFPTTSTTYKLVAKGSGGQTEGSVRINVRDPQAPPVSEPEPARPAPRGSLQDRINREVGDIFFDYDQSEIREDSRATLQRNTEALKAILKDFPTAIIAVEGHADERGSAEYNLGLGDRRATAAKEFLGQVGVPADRLRTISYGKEKPQCTAETEDCHAKNRRVHFAAQ
jgi:peptidoglycan-associated lipoprotein